MAPALRIPPELKKDIHILDFPLPNETAIRRILNDLIDLEFSYGTAPVLRGLDLSVEAGEVVCLLGPNGVGKTTLVENLLGSLTPTNGTVRVLGTERCHEHWR